MGNRDFMESLMDALKDTNVREKIKEIVTVNRIRENKPAEKNNNIPVIKELQKKLEDAASEKEFLCSQAESLQMEKEKLERDNLSLKSRISTLENQNIQMENGYKKEIQKYINSQEQYIEQARKLEQACNLYKNRYEKMEYYYNQYLSLGESAHKKLRRILNAETLEMFMAWGTQWDNIQALWKEISFWLDEYPGDTVNRLSGIFDYFFSIYYENNQYGGKKKYTRQEVNIGDEFDDFLYTRKGGAVAGKITEVLLLGYGQTDGEEFELKEKSIVKI